MWDLPRQGIEPVSPAMAGGFLSPSPPGKAGGDYTLPVHQGVPPVTGNVACNDTAFAELK